MSKVTYSVEFSGRAEFEFDTDDYPNYSPTEEAGLAEDIFYDHAELRGGPFGNSGGSEFYNAFFEKEQNS